MYVRIIKSKLPSYWYSDKIGKVYEVKPCERHENQYELVDDRLRFIDIFDCVEVDITKTNRNDNSFAVGDVVLLKSDKYIPERATYMTVSWNVPDTIVTGYVQVTYFDKNGVLQERNIQSVLLTKV